MKRHCDICGLEADEYWMFPYNTEKKKMWLCWDCYKKSQREANLSDRHRQHKLYKITYQSKKRNG